MVFLLSNKRDTRMVLPSLRAKAKQSIFASAPKMDCHVAALLAMTKWRIL